MTPLTKLFELGRIGKLALQNRLVMAPIGNAVASDEGYVTQRIIDYFVERAKGGVGLILSGGSSVLPHARTPSAMWIYDDKFVPGLRKLAEAVHSYNVPMGLQLNHLYKVLSASRDPVTVERSAVACGREDDGPLLLGCGVSRGTVREDPLCGGPVRSAGG